MRYQSPIPDRILEIKSVLEILHLFKKTYELHFAIWSLKMAIFAHLLFSPPGTMESMGARELT